MTGASEGQTDTSSAASEKDGARRPRGVLLFLRDLLVIFVVAVLVSFLIKTFLIRPFFIPSESMAQTLMVDDRVLVNELVPELVPISRGDVIVFKDPGGWLQAQPEIQQPPLVVAVDGFLAFVGLSAPDSNDHLIKRVIGLPSDHVTCCNPSGQMSVNGVPLDEPYIFLPPGDTRASEADFDVVVPDGMLWVMGDNRDHSLDSRFNGAVPIENVVGRAFVVSWPIPHWAWIDNYLDVFKNVPPPE